MEKKEILSLLEYRFNLPDAEAVILRYARDVCGCIEAITMAGQKLSITCSECAETDRVLEQGQ